MDQLKDRKTALTVNEPAELLNVNPLTIYRLCAKGSIPHFRVGAAIRFSPARLAAWLEKHSIG